MALAPITLKYKTNEWVVDVKLLSSWLTLVKAGEIDNQDKIIVSIKDDLIKNYLVEFIAPNIDKKAIDALFEVKNNRVSKFQASRDGLKLDIEASIKNIKSELDKENNLIDLIVNKEIAKSNTSDVNDLGINEIVGTGHSNFAGSPANRRHNIRTGASSLSGMLIKPNEEFSLNNALGEINADTGYLPELVIKGNKTIPEYGGGLCQIGTTMFRTALAAGLPITQRRNHSYRVSYYEPAGTDATIYNPWPDFRFINDTPKHLLIQYRIEGNDLYFDLWGTKDGRLASTTDPIIYNITKPGPTKYIETLDLEVGKKKCTEHAHNGADAFFDYTVTYPPDIATTTPIVKETRFSSHYIPWQEVCLIGVEELIATSTEDIIDE